MNWMRLVKFLINSKGEQPVNEKGGGDGKQFMQTNVIIWIHECNMNVQMKKKKMSCRIVTTSNRSSNQKRFRVFDIYLSIGQN